MRNAFLEVATTPAVVEARLRIDGRDRYAPDGGPATNDRLGAAERAFLAAADGLYVASVSETGWPYVQFRGGPPGFLRVADDRALEWTELQGNRQYLTVGNVSRDPRVCLFVMDYRNARRLKILGRLVLQEVGAERRMRVELVGFDWNCPQHIPLRFSTRDVEALVAENHRLRAALAAR